MLKKISFVFLLSIGFMSCEKNEIDSIDAVEKKTSSAVSKPRTFESKTITSAYIFPQTSTGCSSEPTLHRAPEWYVSAPLPFQTYASNGVIASSPYIVHIKREDDNYYYSRTIRFGVIHLLNDGITYIIRNVILSVNNNGTITPGNYTSNENDSFIVSTNSGYVLHNNSEPLFHSTHPAFNHYDTIYDGGSFTAGNWYIKINNCSIVFEGCQRKLSLNYEVYAKDATGLFRRLFGTSSFVGLAVQ